MKVLQGTLAILNKNTTLCLCLIACLFTAMPAIIAYALTLPHPTGGSVMTSPFGMRVHPKLGTLRPHKGTDYRAQTPTPVDIGPAQSVTCKVDPQGYGSYADVRYECDVMARFAHLSQCNEGSKTVVSGNSGPINTGPHLHYEIHLGGAIVDPEMAKGKDLCDPAVREELIRDANEKLNGLAGKDGKVPPPTGGGQNTTYVPPGSPGMTIPNGTGGTITIPPGGGYYIYTDVDGRVRVVPNRVDLPDSPTIPPGTSPNLTPTTDTDNEITGCATDTWTAMVNQAVLQSRREMLMNQRFVTKPDSVMAYACITDAMDNVRKDLGPVFSETKRWVNVDIDIIGATVNVNKELGEYSLDGALVNVAYFPYEQWLRSNFNHGFQNDAEGAPDEGQSYQSYASCGTMSQIWKLAKCNNVDDETLFYKFEDLISNDPRKFPYGYECNYTGITQEQIDTAKGKNVKFDKIVTHLDLLMPETCAPAIMTGVTVTRREAGQDERVSEEVTYPDGLCISPGCSYQKDGNGGGSCVVK